MNLKAAGAGLGVGAATSSSQSTQAAHCSPQPWLKYPLPGRVGLSWFAFGSGSRMVCSACLYPRGPAQGLVCPGGSRNICPADA